MSEAAEVHRANQLNPCHALFHQSRGLSASAAKEAAQAATQSAKKAAAQPTSQDETQKVGWAVIAHDKYI